MKSKKEIEELAEEFLTFYQEGSKVYHIKIREAIAFAYTQCQEDNADKKYTEEDLRIAFDTGYYTRDSFGDRSNNMTAEEYINSLNKQD